jgi:hypothetical protein
MKDYKNSKVNEPVPLIDILAAVLLIIVTFGSIILLNLL